MLQGVRPITGLAVVDCGAQPVGERQLQNHAIYNRLVGHQIA